MTGGQELQLSRDDRSRVRRDRRWAMSPSPSPLMAWRPLDAAQAEPFTQLSGRESRRQVWVRPTIAEQGDSMLGK